MTALIWNIHLVMRYDSSRAIIKIQETNNGINAYSNKQSRNPLRSEYFRDSLPKLFSPVFLFKQNTSYKKHYVKYGNLLYRSIEFCFRISMNFLEFGWNRGIGYLYYNKYDQTSELMKWRTEMPDVPSPSWNDPTTFGYSAWQILSEFEFSVAK